jgi:hypothetical protein
MSEDTFGWPLPPPIPDIDPRVAALYDYDPADIKRVIKRFWGLLPEGHGLDLGWFSMALVGHLAGVDLRDAPENTPEEITACADLVEQVLTFELEEGKRYSIGTMAGAIHSLQYDSMAEHFEAIQRVAKTDTPLGVAGPWTCPFCAREWLAGTEPDKCPDCDALLMRATIMAKPEEEGA